MKLKELKFTRFKGQANEWAIEGKPKQGNYGQWFSLGNINLIAGKNASGKSRTIDAIRHISDLVSGAVQLTQLNAIGYGTGEYDLRFEKLNGEVVEYYLDFKDGKIIDESLSVSGKVKLNRKEGELWYEELNRELSFQTDDGILAISKRDQKQHSFFEDLYSWGKSLNHYRFGSTLGKNALLKDINAITEDKEADLKDGDEVAEIFTKGIRSDSSFENLVIKDMKSISYDLTKIETSRIKNFPLQAYGLNVHESGFKEITDQREMSQGMFRALSLLVQINYALLNQLPSCILIDDIGEGLDYDRSSALIDLIIQKTRESPVQLIMTTNDRFIMNNVPLEFWSVIQRIPGKSLFYNYANSKDTFEEFKFTGLSNFDFLATEFYIENFDSEKNS